MRIGFFMNGKWGWGELCGVVTQRRGFDYLSFRQRARASCRASCDPCRRPPAPAPAVSGNSQTPPASRTPPPRPPKTKPPSSPATATCSTSSPHAAEPKSQKSPSPRQPHKEWRQSCRHNLLNPMPRRIRDLISDLRKAGFALDRQKGSHRQFKHPSFQGLITPSGGEGGDAKTYQKRQVTKAIAD